MSANGVAEVGKDSLLKLGCGVGLRTTHYSYILEKWPKVDWFEAISENYMDSGGRPLQILEKVRSRYPVALHGVSLSLGSTDPLNQTYLKRLKALAERIEPVIVSDHLCWSGVAGENLHDLLPLPFTREAVAHVVSRIQQVQEFLGRKILIENVSTYVTYTHSTMPEWEFLSEIAARSGCGILLDLNNIFVNSVNHRFDPLVYLANIPPHKVGQFHLAGHTDMGTFLFDTHSKPVIDPVWELYREALKRWGQISTLIEWDEDIPEFPKLEEECARAKFFYDQFENWSPEIGEAPRLSFPNDFIGNPESKNLDSCFRRNDKISQSLAEVLNQMKTYVRPLSRQQEGPCKENNLLNPQGGVSGKERMSVYAGGYVARVQEGLADVYEAVQFVLGPERFSALAESYGVRYPSHQYNLSRIGIHLPEFIRTFSGLDDVPFLADLAQLEWLMAEAFHAFDKPPFVPHELAEIPLEDWERTQVVFQPSVSIFHSPWPVLDIWKEKKSSDRNQVRWTGEKKPQCILIGRQETRVRCELLSPAQHRLLEGLLQGRTLGEVCEDLSELEGGEDLPVAAWFSRWVADGLVVSCEIKRHANVSCPQ